MPASLSVVVAKDGNQTIITGGLRALDASGTGSGPFTMAHVLLDAAGTNLASISAGGALKVDNSGVTQTVTGTVAATQSGTWTVLPGNTANTTAWKVQLYDGTTALPILAASSGAPATSVAALAVSVRDALTAIGGANPVGGAVATNVAITENPINLGVQAVSSENTAVTATRKVQLVADLVGKLIVLPYANPENFLTAPLTTAMTDTADHTVLAAPGAGLRNYITSVVVSNAHATVGTEVVIKDGTAGSVLATFPAAAVYGGATFTLPVPIRQPTTNTLICAANLTTGSSTKITLIGYKGA